MKNSSLYDTIKRVIFYRKIMSNNALAHLQNFPKEPGFWDGQERETDNQAYQDETINFTDAKDNLRNSLYGDFSSENTKNAEIQKNREIFSYMPEWKILKEVLWEKNKDIFDAISLKYGETLNVYESIKSVITEQWWDLWLVFEKESDRDKLIDALISVAFWEEIFVSTIPERSEIWSLEDTPDISVLKENPSYPIIERFREEGYLTQENENDVISNMSMGIEMSDILKPLSLSPDTQHLVHQAMESLHNPEQNKKNFENDINEIADKKVDLEDTITSLVAENYVRIPNIQWEITMNPERIDADLSLAFRISANKILENSAGIDRTTETFRTAMQYIQGNDHKEQYKWLQMLFNQSSADKWKWKLKKEQNIRFAQQKKKKNLVLQEKFESIQALLDKARKYGDQKKIAEQRENMKVLQNDASKQEHLSGWEVLDGGQNDILAQIDTKSKDNRFS